MNSLEIIGDYLSSNGINGLLWGEGDALSEGIPYITIDKAQVDGDGRIDVEVEGSAIKIWRYRLRADKQAGNWEGPIDINLSEPDSLGDLIRAIEYLKTNPPKIANDLFWDRATAP